MRCVEFSCSDDRACMTPTGPCAWAFTLDELDPDAGVCTACADRMRLEYFVACGRAEPSRVELR
jgi:hypothetical protein